MNVATSTKRRAAKGRGKVYFVRLNEQSYKALGKLADTEDMSINLMANLLIKQKLKEQKLL